MEKDLLVVYGRVVCNKEVKSMSQWDAIIVGAGISGLSAGALLATSGKKVLILEKDAVIGGRAGSTTYRGHVVDNGIHGLTNLGYMEDILTRAGKNMPDAVAYEGTEALRDGEWINLGNLLMNENVLRMMTEGALSPSYEELDKFDDISIKDWGLKWTDDESAHFLLWFLAWAFLGGNKYEDMVANELLTFIKEVQEKCPEAPAMGTINFLKGLSGLTDRLVEAVQERGGEIRTSTRVVDVVILDGKAQGVNIETGERVFKGQLVDTEFIDAPLIIVTLPVWDLFKVVPEDVFPAWYVDWIRRISLKTAPLFTLICGMDKLLWDNWKMTRWVPMLPRTGLGACFLFAPPSFAESAGEYQGMFWLQTHWDECPNLFEANEAKDRVFLRKIFDNFEEDIKELFPDFEKHCKWKVRHLDTFSIARAPGLTSRHRPSVKPPGIENLYIVGDTVREARGSGMEAGARAALNLVDNVLS